MRRSWGSLDISHESKKSLKGVTNMTMIWPSGRVLTYWARALLAMARRASVWRSIVTSVIGDGVVGKKIC